MLLARLTTASNASASALSAMERSTGATLPVAALPGCCANPQGSVPQLARLQQVRASQRHAALLRSREISVLEVQVDGIQAHGILRFDEGMGGFVGRAAMKWKRSPWNLRPWRPLEIQPGNRDVAQF